MLCALILATSSVTSELTVLAAASLRQPLDEIARSFEAANPGVKLRISYAGSQELAIQINLGAPADVFLSADQVQMNEVLRSGKVSAVDVKPFASNQMSLLVSASASKRVHRLQDLANPGLRICIAGEMVPAGAYASAVLRKASKKLGGKWLAQVRTNTVSKENNVATVMARIELDEADAGLVYHTDAKRAKRSKGHPIPKEWNVKTTYFLAVPKLAPNAGAARRFVQAVLERNGQRVLAGYGFLPP